MIRPLTTLKTRSQTITRVRAESLALSGVTQWTRRELRGHVLEGNKGIDQNLFDPCAIV
jgi:hypothetical protein